MLVDQCLDKAVEGAIIDRCPGNLTEAANRFRIFQRLDRFAHSWPKMLGRSSALYLKATANEQETMKRLIGLGSRQQQLVVGQSSDIFGLDGSRLVFSMDSEEDKVSYLPHIASKTNFRPDDLLIHSFSSSSGNLRGPVGPYVMTTKSSKTSSISSYHHLRWRIVRTTEDQTMIHEDGQWHALRMMFLKVGEHLLQVDRNCIDLYYPFGDLTVVWNKPPDYYNSRNTAVEGSYSYVKPNTARFEFLAGNPKGVALLARANTLDAKKDIRLPREDLEEIIRHFTKDSIVPSNLFDHFLELQRRADERYGAHHRYISSHGEEMVPSLQASAAFAMIYDTLPHAIVSADMAQFRCLHRANWTTKHKTIKSLSKTRKAMFSFLTTIRPRKYGDYNSMLPF